jgi:hypothetical protein
MRRHNQPTDRRQRCRLEQDIRVNEQALNRKQPLSKLALAFLALAVTVELIGALS